MMPRLLNAFFLMLCRSSEADLIRQIEYLRAENRVLRSKLPKRIAVTPGEREYLVKMGRRVGSAIKELVTIVHLRTFARWVQMERGEKPKPQRRGRPRTPEETRQIVLRLARENDWGFTRLWGELKKLNILIGKTTLRKILKENGIDPGPKRLTDGTWDRFIKRHAATLWQCDFITHRVWTLKGRVDCCLLFFIHVGSRRVWVSPATTRPTPLWVAQQARNFSMWAAEQGMTIRHIVRDRLDEPPPPPGSSGSKPVEMPLGQEPRGLLRPKEPNRVWHCDLTVIRVLWIRLSVAAVVDGFSRKILALKAYRGAPTSREMVRLIERTAERYGQPRFLITDHGCQFRRRFHESMDESGIIHVKGRVRSFAMNGKVERVFQTFKLWQRVALIVLRERSRQRQLEAFRQWLNRHRPHSMLEGRTPQEAWDGIK